MTGSRFESLPYRSNLTGLRAGITRTRSNWISRFRRLRTVELPDDNTVTLLATENGAQLCDVKGT
jgi:hypothetical protein